MSVIQSEGRIMEIDRPWTWPANNRFGQLRMYNQTVADYAAIYSSQPALRMVVDFLARNLAQIDIHTFRKLSQTNRQREEGHGLARMIDEPMPGLTTYTWVRDLVSYLGVYDCYFAIKIGADAGMGLLPVPPWKMDVLGDNSFFPGGFKLVGSHGTLPLKREQVFYLHGFNPLDSRIGLSPIETLRRLLDEAEASGDYRENYWRNAARAEVLLSRPENAPAWSDLARERFRADWQALYSGSGGSGLTAILEDGMTASELNFSAVDSQYLEARKLTREEVASAYHVAPTLVGILDHATFSNIREQHQMLYQDTLGPWTRFMEQEIKAQLLPEFTDTSGLYVEFNIEEKLRGSFEDQANALRSALGGRPWMLPDEARAIRNMPPVGGAWSEPADPVNMATADQSAAPKAAEWESVVADFFDRQKRIVLSRIGAKQRSAAAAALDVERWTRELTQDLGRLDSPNGKEAVAV